MDYDDPGVHLFVPPANVTTVFVQAWGGGGGGASGFNPVSGSGGGAGGFAWCVLPVQPSTPVTVFVAAGGVGQSGESDGLVGGNSGAINSLGNFAAGRGGLGGKFLPPAGGAGGMGECNGIQGTVRQGADGSPGTFSNTAPGGLGGRPAVDGIIQPAPASAGTGGTGGAAGADTTGDNGGNGYVVIWW